MCLYMWEMSTNNGHAKQTKNTIEIEKLFGGIRERVSQYINQKVDKNRANEIATAKTQFYDGSLIITRNNFCAPILVWGREVIYEGYRIFNTARTGNPPSSSNLEPVRRQRLVHSICPNHMLLLASRPASQPLASMNQ